MRQRLRITLLACLAGFAALPAATAEPDLERIVRELAARPDDAGIAAWIAAHRPVISAGLVKTLADYGRHRLGDHQGSAVFFSYAAAVISRELAALEPRAHAFWTYADVLRACGHPVEAGSVYRSVRDTCRTGKLPGYEGLAWAGLGGLALERGDAAGALTAFRAAVPLLETAGDGPAVAGCQNNIGAACFRLGDLAGAEAGYTAAAAAYRALGQTHEEAVCVFLTGQVVRQQKQPARARDLYARARAGLLAAGDTKRVAACDFNLGNLWLELGRFETARGHYLECLRYHERATNTANVAECHAQLASTAHAAGAKPEAEFRYGQAHAAYMSIAATNEAAVCLQWLAALAAERGARALAVERETAAAALHRSITNLAEEAHCLYRIGLHAKAAGDAMTARARFRAALTGYQAAGAATGASQANALMALADLDWAASALADAGRGYDEAAALYTAAGVKTYAAYCLRQAGECARLRGDLAAADARLARARAAYLALGDRSGAAWCRMALGNVAFSRGDNPGAAAALGEALAEYRALGEGVGEASVRKSLGDMAVLAGDRELARAQYRRARALYEAAGERLGTANCEYYLGQLEHHVGVYVSKAAAARAAAAAAPHYVRARALYAALGDRLGEANCLNALGRCAESRGERAAADADWARALAAYRALGVAFGEANCLLAIAGAEYGRGRRPEAAARYAQARAIYRERLDNPHGSATCSFQLALCRDAAGDLRGMLARCTELVADLERVRRQAAGVAERRGALDRYATFWDYAIRAAVRAGAPATAWNWLEASRARSLLEELARASLLEPGLLPAALAAELGAARDALAGLRDRAARLREGGVPDSAEALAAAAAERRYEALLARALEARPGLRERGRPRLLDEAAARAALPAGTALVTYQLSEPSYAFVLTRERLTVVELPPHDRILPSARAWYQLLSEPGRRHDCRAEGDGIFLADAGTNSPARRIERPEALRRAGRFLWRSLVAPLLPALAGAGRLVVVADPVIGFLPLEALVDGEGRRAVETLDIAYAPSASLHAALAARRSRAVMPLAAFGGALYGGRAAADRAERGAAVARAVRGVGYEDAAATNARPAWPWEDLPGSLREVLEIGKLWYTNGDPRSAVVVTGRGASEAVVKALSRAGKLAACRFVHFATHGIADGERPDLSALVFSRPASAADGDGYLTMAEILALDLDAELVLLSACETGLGKTLHGEGVVGLAQGFLLAGSRRVAVSSWQVDDEATRAFMTRVHARLARGGDCRSAFRETRREFIDGDAADLKPAWRDPFYWAAFALWGP